MCKQSKIEASKPAFNTETALNSKRKFNLIQRNSGNDIKLGEERLQCFSYSSPNTRDHVCLTELDKENNVDDDELFESFIPLPKSHVPFKLQPLPSNKLSVESNFVQPRSLRLPFRPQVVFDESFPIQDLLLPTL